MTTLTDKQKETLGIIQDIARGNYSKLPLGASAIDVLMAGAFAVLEAIAYEEFAPSDVTDLAFAFKSLAKAAEDAANKEKQQEGQGE